jgi:hypothetical protein
VISLTLRMNIWKTAELPHGMHVPKMAQSPSQPGLWIAVPVDGQRFPSPTTAKVRILKAWSSKNWWLGNREKGCYGKARSEKMWECQPQSEARL